MVFFYLEVNVHDFRHFVPCRVELFPDKIPTVWTQHLVVDLDLYLAGLKAKEWKRTGLSLTERLAFSCKTFFSITGCLIRFLGKLLSRSLCLYWNRHPSTLNRNSPNENKSTGKFMNPATFTIIMTYCCNGFLLEWTTRIFRRNGISRKKGKKCDKKKKNELNLGRRKRGEVSEADLYTQCQYSLVVRERWM